MENRQLLYDLFQAYYDARKNKRNTSNALAFEIDYETKLFDLYQEIKSEKYEISPSICFISFFPKKREIFAADFRDRIIHHLIFNYINPFFERLFINDAYSCRKKRGTSYGIKRLDHFIRSCSKNYKQDCYILKIDIKGYFMAIDHSILYQKIKNMAGHFKGKFNFDVDFISRLIHKVIFHNHTKDCHIKGVKKDWQGLPKSKSLFYTSKDKGLPIGNLTSQLFGNVYLNDFDHFVKYNLKCKYYGRYVDDIVIAHPDKKYLKSIIPVLKRYLEQELSLELHPKKIYFQHFKKGVAFLGVVIKPYRIYIRNQTKGNFCKKVQKWNNLFIKNKFRFNKNTTKLFLSSINSYLGIMKYCNAYKLRRKILVKNFLSCFYPHIYTFGNYDIIKLTCLMPV